MPFKTNISSFTIQASKRVKEGLAPHLASQAHVQASVHTRCPQNTSLFLKHQIDLCKTSVEDFFKLD